MAGEAQAKPRKTRQMKLDEALWRAVAYQSLPRSPEEKAAAVSKVEELLAKGADPNAWQCLHSAARHESIKIASLLKEGGARLDERDRSGLTPAHCALIAGRGAMLDWLLSEGADPNGEPCLGGERLLDFAARSRDFEACERLIKAGARALPNERGETALHRAMLHGSAAIVRLLVLKADCDIDQRDDRGETGLDLALRNFSAYERNEKLAILQSPELQGVLKSRQESKALEASIERGRGRLREARL